MKKAIGPFIEVEDKSYTPIKSKDYGYDKIHSYFSKYFKKTGKCFDCKKDYSDTEWSLQKGKQHSYDIRHYKERCKKCHRTYDAIRGRKWVMTLNGRRRKKWITY
jgi:hypothetical protein